MLNQTRRALEDFDNQHEFERLAADVLNALGYSGVEPMALAVRTVVATSSFGRAKAWVSLSLRSTKGFGRNSSGI